MITCDSAALSTAPITDLALGDIFILSGKDGRFTAVLVENHEGKYLSWMHLTGKQQFFMDDLGTSNQYVHAFKVLRLGLKWSDLHVQIEETSVVRAASEPKVGSLLVGDVPRIVTQFCSKGSGPDGGDLFGVSLRNLSREHISQFTGYVCERWKLMAAPQGLPAELIAEFPVAKSE